MQPNEIIKKHIAPCGLHCGGCFAFNGGNIQKHSTELIKSLGNFDVYANASSPCSTNQSSKTTRVSK